MPDKDGKPVDSSGLAADRRRRGRRDLHPSLIPLLRRPTGDGVALDGEPAWQLDSLPALAGGGDALAAARGMAMGLVLSAPLWGAVAMLSLALRR